LWELNTYVTGEVLGFPNKLAFFTGRDQSQLRTSYFAQLRAGLPFTLRL
jgi:hypothetical protein